MSSIFCFAKDTVTDIDIFGREIKLNYKGKDSFKTFFGGCTTLVIFAVMIAYTVFLINQIINRRGANTTISTEIKDLQVNPDDHQPGLDGFQIAVAVSDRDDNIFYNESYFKVRFYQGLNTRDELILNNTNTLLESTTCTNSIIDKYILGYSGNNSAIICPKNDDYTLSGAFSSQVFKFFAVSVTKWSILNNDTNCASDAEIDAKLLGGRIGIVIVNSYMDFEDYDTVIKSYPEDRFSYKISSGISKEPQIYVRKNYVSLNDNFFQTGLTENKEFYSVSTSDNDFDIDPTGINYARVTIRMEAREDTYERTVFSVFDFTGLIGGVFEIFEIIGGIFVGYFSSTLFLFSMLTNLYQVQKIDDTTEQEFTKVLPTTRKISIKTGKKQLHEEFKASANQIENPKDENMSIVNQPQ